MLSPSDGVDADSIDTASCSTPQSPSDIEDTSPYTLPSTSSSYASPFLLSPTFLFQTPEPLTMENIFQRLHMSLSENGSFGCSARVNEAIRCMVATTSEGIPAIPSPNGFFTLFGSSIVLQTPPNFSFHSGEFQFHGKSNILHPVPNPSLQPHPCPAVPNIVPPLNHRPEAGPSSSHFPQSLASSPRFPEPLTSSGPPLLIEPLAPGRRLPVGYPTGFLSPSPLPSGSYIPPVNLHPTCHLSDPEAIASSSQVPEPLPPGFRLPDALPTDFLLPDPKGKGKMPLIDEAAQRRRIRMNKNRESAARSRARRKAYTAVLEREIQYLTEENDRLRRETAEIRFELAEQETTRKRWFGRAASPPF